MADSNPFKELMGTIGSGLTAGFTSNAASSLFGGDNDAVDEAARMMDTLYPGTTPFERLSNGGGGAAGAGATESASSKAQKAQLNLANAQIGNERAKIQKDRENVSDTNKAMLAGKWMDNLTMRGLGFAGNPIASAIGLDSGIPGYLGKMFGDGTMPSNGPDKTGDSFTPDGGEDVPYWNEYTKDKAEALGKKRAENAERSKAGRIRQDRRNKSHQWKKK